VLRSLIDQLRDDVWMMFAWIITEPEPPPVELENSDWLLDEVDLDEPDFDDTDTDIHDCHDDYYDDCHDDYHEHGDFFDDCP